MKYTQYDEAGTGTVGRYQNSGTCSMSVCLYVCLCVCGTLISKIPRCPTLVILRVLHYISGFIHSEGQLKVAVDLEAKEPLRGFRHREDFVCEGKKVWKFLQNCENTSVLISHAFLKVLVEFVRVRTGDMPPVARSEASATAGGALSTRRVDYQVRICDILKP